MTIAPNRARLGLLEIKHPELSVHIKFEGKKKALKGLQTAMRKSGENQDTPMLTTHAMGS